MIDDENDPALCAELIGLTEGLTSWLGEELDPESVQLLFDYVEEHRRNARMKGIDFPALTALVIPRLGWIKLVRKDLTEMNIRRAVMAMLRECPSINIVEASRAIKKAWPTVGLSTIIDEAEFKIDEKIEGLGRG